MSCEDCNKSKGIDIIGGREYVRCASMKHARFMDELGGNRFESMVKAYGFMSVLSESEVGIECPNFDDGSENDPIKFKHNNKPCRKCKHYGTSIHGRCLNCGNQVYYSRYTKVKGVA